MRYKKQIIVMIMLILFIILSLIAYYLNIEYNKAHVNETEEM